MLAYSNTEMPACFTIIGSIASTTRKFVNDVRAQAMGHFIFELLREEISVKESKVKTFDKDFILLQRKLRETLSIIDYTHLCCLFLTKNDRKLKHQQDIHSKKLFDLVLKILKHYMTLIKLVLIIHLMV